VRARSGVHDRRKCRRDPTPRGVGRDDRPHTVRLASTCSVYGAGHHELNESSPLRPKSAYAESKVAGERIVLGESAIEPVALRFGTVFGAGRRPRFDLVVNLLTAKAAAGDPIRIFGGEQWRPFVHVEDIVTAIELALNSESSVVAGEIFNVGSARENRRLAEIGEVIREFVPDADIEIDHSSGDQRDYRADFSKISDRLGFTPAWTLRDGIEQLLQVLRDNPSLDYRDASYANELALKQLRDRSGALGLGFDRITAG
jgi:nucleoside-diphosphate-sugar epimerase